jgi:hypothetical protein
VGKRGSPIVKQSNSAIVQKPEVRKVKIKRKCNSSKVPQSEVEKGRSAIARASYKPREIERRALSQFFSHPAWVAATIKHSKDDNRIIDDTVINGKRKSP